MEKAPNQLTAEKKAFIFDIKTFFTKLGDAAIAFVDESEGTVTSNAAKAIIQIDESEEGALYKIIMEAAFKAMNNIVMEKLNRQEFKGLGSHIFVLNQDIFRGLNTINFTIDKSFFIAPQNHLQVKELQNLFVTWLTQCLKISEDNAKITAAAFPRYFRMALAHSDRKLIDKVKAFFENPFFDNYEHEALRDRYHAKLMAEYSCNAFGNQTIALSDLYIEPFFTVFEHHIKIKDNEEKEKYFSKPYHHKDVDKKDSGFLRPNKRFNAHEYFYAWLQNNNLLELRNGNGQLMILLGQPGQGKTSFCLHTIHQLLTQETEQKNIFWFRLKEMEGSPTALIENPLTELKNKFSKAVFDGKAMDDKEWDNGLLILDGLDELLMNKNMNNEQARLFLNNIKRDIKELQRYTNAIQLKCFITSRHHYVSLEQFNNDEWLILSLDSMTFEQQRKWLLKYEFFVTNNNKKEYLNLLYETLEKLDYGKDKKEQELRNLVNQPILLTLIAQSEVPLDLNIDRAAIYKNMFDVLENRAWSSDQIRPLKALGTDPKVKRFYRQFLQQLALHIFQSKYEYVRKSDFESKDTHLAGAYEKLKNCFAANDFDVEKALISFYFKQVVKQYDDKQQADEHHNYAFEFLHKSLQEYLVAEGIWQYCQKLVEKNSDEEFIINKKEAFKQLFKVYFAKRILSNEIIEYLKELIWAKDNNDSKMVAIRERLKEIFNYACEHHFLLEYDAENNKIEVAPLALSVAMFYGLWSVLSHTALFKINGKNFEKISEEDRLEANCILNKNRDTITDYLIQLRRYNISHLILSFQIFLDADLRGADLRGADFNGADFSGVDLQDADLRGADLRSTNFLKADLSLADLRECKLKGSDLHSTNTSGTIFSGLNY